MKLEVVTEEGTYMKISILGWVESFWLAAWSRGTIWVYLARVMTRCVWLPLPVHCRTCEEFAKSNSLKFSTDPDPQKCKTKTVAFLKKPKSLPSMYLCGNPLPWINKFKHLEMTIENKIDGRCKDLNEKNAKYISKNIELN